MEVADISKIEFNSLLYVHLVAEAMRRLSADRAEFLGDPRFQSRNAHRAIDFQRKFAKTHGLKNLDLTKASIVGLFPKYGQLYGGDHTNSFFQ